MSRRSTIHTGLSLFFCFGVLALGCGGDNGTTKKLDAGRGGSGGGSSAKGGSGGSGGSSATGGSSARGGSGGSTSSGGAGGSSASGGAGGSGGSTATGGSTSNGGAGGGTATGGAGGSAGAGGATATGGMTATGGSGGSDAGAVDGAATDAIDVPLVSDDAARVDTGGLDNGTPISVDAEGLDGGGLDGALAEATTALLDAGADTTDTAADLSEPDLAPDAEPDLAADLGPDGAPDLGPGDLLPNPVPCSSVPIVSVNAGASAHTYQPGVGTSICFATCDDIAGWSCGQVTGRQVYLDGQLISNCSGGPPIPAKVAGSYHIFQLSAGSDPSAFITWWLNSPSAGASCLAPDGGFGLD